MQLHGWDPSPITSSGCFAPLDGSSEVPEIMAAHKFDGIRFHFLRSPTKTPTETQNTHNTKYTPLKLWISEMNLTKITGYFGLVKYDLLHENSAFQISVQSLNMIPEKLRLYFPELWVK